MGGKRVLIVFDFDHTLINCNSDVEVMKLGPCGGIPDELQKLRESMGLTEFMQKIFDYLDEKQVTRKDVTAFIRSLPFTPGAQDLVKVLKDNFQSELIIISDANSFFIDQLLQEAELTSYFTAVFTHPAKFQDGSDRLTVTRLNPDVVCEEGAGGMCKGHILKEYIAKRQEEELGGGGRPFDVIAYVGDGFNDFCPMTTLPGPPGGLAFVRRDYGLHKYLNSSSTSRIKAGITYWQDILTVAKTLQSALD